MAIDRLDSIRTKTHRAKKHIDDLAGELRSFLDLDPYRVHSYDDAETGDRVCQLVVAERFPYRALAIIGDAIHNLRSALDHLACELSTVSEGAIDEHTAFPIWRDIKTVAEAKAEIARKIPSASAEMIEVIEELEPYQGGKGDILWRLHRLDILDKHRLLITAAAIPYWSDVPRPIKLSPRGCTFEHGAELLRVPRVARDQTTMNMNPKFKFQVAFGEIIEGEPVIPALEKFLDAVNGVIAVLGGFLI
ncbi:hypothetical protein [Candidatus Binatus sp.]|uniref:hypothetical protein n=1 Tax=Candidatus Binatus sp. TaxID=2811406 RepID=UPI003F9D2718